MEKLFSRTRNNHRNIQQLKSEYFEKKMESL